MSEPIWQGADESLPPPRTVDTTIFEMWLGSLSTHRGLSIPVLDLKPACSRTTPYMPGQFESNRRRECGSIPICWERPKSPDPTRCGPPISLTCVNGGEIMYRQGGSRAEMWRLKSVPPVAFNQERPNLTEGGLDVQGGYLPPCSQGLFRRRDERPRGGPSVRATPGHGAQDARVLRAPRVSTATTGSQTEARSI